MKQAIRSLGFKLTLAFLLIGITGAALVALIIWRQIQAAFSTFIFERERQTLAQSLQDYYAEHGSWAGVDQDVQLIQVSIPVEGPLAAPEVGEARRVWGWLTLLDAEQRVLMGGGSLRPGQGFPNLDMDNASPIKVDGETVGYLVLTPGADERALNSRENAFIRQVARAAALSALVAAALALPLGGFLAYQLTRSLREMQTATQAIARGEFGQQVRVRTGDELGELARAFNQMSRQLETLSRARRQMTADIAHDLRTPLSVLTGYTEALSDGKLRGSAEIYQVLHNESRLLNRLVEDLRTLSLADTGELTMNYQPVDAAQLLAQTAARHAQAAELASLRLKTDIPHEAALLRADPERLSQVLDNLITNAMRHTAAGGEVSLGLLHEDGHIRLLVHDTGEGIAPDDLPYIFDRFYKGDKARSQSGESGLGLAIAKSIIEMHGGALTVNSLPGHGATFTVSLPALASAQQGL